MSTITNTAKDVLDAVEARENESATDLDVALGRVLVEFAESGFSATIDAMAQLPTTLGQTTKAGSLSVTLASNEDALPITDNSGSLTVDSAQLPTALGQTTMSASMPVAIASNQTAIPVTDNSGSLTIDETPGTTGAASSVAMTATSATLLAANSARYGMIIFNPLSVTLYVRFENADAAAVQTIQILPGDTYEMPRRYYTGIVKGALASSTGNVFVTEVT